VDRVPWCGAGSLAAWQLRNEPCLVQGVLAHMPRITALVEAGRLREDAFTALFGASSLVPVQHGDGQQVDTVSVEHFLGMIHSDDDGSGGGPYYLKDWHAARSVSDLYTVPPCFADDWLNWFYQHCRQKSDDYSFVYVGSKGSSTGLHHDVVFSYSWSVNVSGRKVWTLYYPPALGPGPGPDPDPASSSPSLGAIATATTTATATATVTANTAARATPLVVIQNVGEAIFVPSGWFHTVRNIVPSELQPGQYIDPADLSSPGADQKLADVTVSVNQNWFNGFNIYQVWRFIVRELSAVRQEMWHLKRGTVESRDAPELCMNDGEWVCHCEVLLRANASMGLSDMLELCVSRLLSLLSTAPRPRDCISSSWAALFCPNFKPEGKSAATMEDATMCMHTPSVPVGQFTTEPGCWHSDFATPNNNASGSSASSSVASMQLPLPTDMLPPSLDASTSISAAVVGTINVVRILDELLLCPVLSEEVLPGLLGYGCDSHSVDTVKNALIAFRQTLHDFVHDL